MLQAHPESLLAKLVDAEGETDGVMVENAGVEPVTIRIDRDPTLFARVLKTCFDTPQPLTADAFHEELDFYGLLPSSAMLPASTIAEWQAGAVERFTTPVVSSIVNQMAKLMKEQLHILDERRFSEASNPQWPQTNSRQIAPELSFWLNLPTGLWTEVQVRRAGEPFKELRERPVKELPSDIQQALETRLHSLGYGVSFSEVQASRVTGGRIYSIDVTQIKLSWANK